MKNILLIVTGFLFTALSLQAGPSKTANFIRSDIASFEGKPVTLDVAYINRVNLELPNHPKIALFVAVTRDEKNNTGGGTILAVVNLDDVAELTKKFGTNYQRNGDAYKTKAMKGIIGRIKNAGQEDILLINLSSLANPETLPIAFDNPEIAAKRKTEN